MALKINYTILENGINIPEAYLKIMYFKGSYKQDDSYNFIISTCVYFDKQAKDNGVKPVIENKEFEFYINKNDIENNPLLNVLYGEIKKIDGFQNAVDI